MKPFISLLLIFCFHVVMAQKQARSCNCPGMAKAGKGNIYISMGFHRVFFTKSDIRFRDSKTGNYDFTLYDVKARDDNDFNVGHGFDAPQYSFRLGYYFNNKADIGIEFNFDHVKYITIQDQKLHVSGQINGVKMDKDTTLTRSFVQYEHTDGANYYLFNLIKRKNLLHSQNKKHWLSAVVKPGIGFVLPRTDSRILGRHRDDRYHLSGYVVGIDGGLRYDFFKHFYIETGAKGAFANYRDVLIYGSGRARQHWFSLQIIAVAGFQFAL
jgi:hypothetical protein